MQLLENTGMLALHHQQNLYMELWLMSKLFISAPCNSLVSVAFLLYVASLFLPTNNLKLVSTNIIKCILNYAAGVWDHLHSYFNISLALLTTSTYFQGRSVKYLLLNSTGMFSNVNNERRGKKCSYYIRTFIRMYLDSNTEERMKLLKYKT